MPGIPAGLLKIIKVIPILLPKIAVMIYWSATLLTKVVNVNHCYPGYKTSDDWLK